MRREISLHLGTNTTGMLGMRMYIDGQEISASSSGGSDTEGMTPDTAYLSIGRIDNSGYVFAGDMAHFTMWRELWGYYFLYF